MAATRTVRLADLGETIDCWLLLCTAGPPGLELPLAASGPGWILLDPSRICEPRWARWDEESCLTNPKLIARLGTAQLLNSKQGKRTKFVDFYRNLYFYLDRSYFETLLFLDRWAPHHPKVRYYSKKFENRTTPGTPAGRGVRGCQGSLLLSVISPAPLDNVITKDEVKISPCNAPSP